MAMSVVAFLLAGMLVFLATPPIRRLAERLDVIDKPDRRRKRHRRLIPLWGGLAIVLGLIPGLWLALLYTDQGRFLLAYRDNFFSLRLWFILSAVILLALMGLLDDWRPLPPKVKLLVQIVASGLAVSDGFFLSGNIGGQVLWLVIGWAVALLWLVFVVNAYNFTDGLDGLASSQAVVVGLTLAAGAGLLSGQAQDLMTRYQYLLASGLSAATAGAALGFWRYNHFPARIFLGDAGSHVLGFGLSLSALLLMGRTATAGPLIFVCLVLGWPLFDTIQVVIRRLRRGEPISKADNRHLHHMLVERGFSNSAAVALIDSIVIVLCLLGMASLWL